MNNKDFINMVEKGIEDTVKQGVKSVDSGSGGDGCYYLKDGLSCPVGHMIPMEIREGADSYPETSILSLSCQGFEWACQFNSEQRDILYLVQQSHDDSNEYDFISSFLDNLESYNINGSLKELPLD